MKTYIDFNRKQRTESNNESDKNFKLMNNAVYGKNVENMWKRIKIRIIKNKKGCIKYTSKPTYARWNIYDKKLVAIHEKKIGLTLNKPIYVGFTALEISKWECIIFIIFLWSKNFTLMLWNAWEKPFQNCKYKGLFDLSNDLKTSKYFSSDNKKIVGRKKDEYEGKLFLEFIDLRSKMYSIRHENNKEKCIIKGHNAYMEISEYRNTLFRKEILRHKVRGIKSKTHNIGTFESNKTSCYDGKRYIVNDGINTLAYGHT